MEKKNIRQKLAYIQQNLKAPKSQFNKFGKYYYRSLEDIQNALKPLLEEVGAVFLLSDKIVQTGDRYHIKATATLMCTETGGTVSNTAYAREAENQKGMDSSQITGVASSYARKYAANGLFAIDDTKDADTDEFRGGYKEPEKKAPPEEVICGICQKPVYPQTGRSGAKLSAKEVYAELGMCGNCYREKRAVEKQEQQEQQQEQQALEDIKSDLQTAAELAETQSKKADKK